MASVLKVKDNEGNIIDIPMLRGGAGKIVDVTASVENSVGEPGVVVTLGGTEEERTIDFAFRGLAGNVDSAGNVIVAELTNSEIDEICGATILDGSEVDL
jgi:hypothetical protein